MQLLWNKMWEYKIDPNGLLTSAHIIPDSWSDKFKN